MDVTPRPTVSAAQSAATTRPLPVFGGQVRGTVDGDLIRLPSGVLLRRRRYGYLEVSQPELLQAARGVELLPMADQQMIARAGIVVDLVPVPVMEQDQVGSTGVSQVGARWYPTNVRVATKSPLSMAGTGKMAIGEIIQHELGHVVEVLEGQDRSEAAADAYAASH